MADPIDPKNVDKRIYDRLANQGMVDEKAYERHLKSLPDLAEKAVSVETVMEGEEDYHDAEAELAAATAEGAPQA
jgi:hypothetical protein